MGRLLNIEDVSERTGAPVATIRYWRATGYGPAMFKLGRRLVIDEAELERWIAEKAGAPAGAS